MPTTSVNLLDDASNEVLGRLENLPNAPVAFLLQKRLVVYRETT
jgi:hypothetical protein